MPKIGPRPFVGFAPYKCHVSATRSGLPSPTESGAEPDPGRGGTCVERGSASRRDRTRAAAPAHTDGKTRLGGGGGEIAPGLKGNSRVGAGARPFALNLQRAAAGQSKSRARESGATPDGFGPVSGAPPPRS